MPGCGGRIKYGVAISEEILGDSSPVLFQGGLEAAMERAASMGFDNVEMHIRNPGSLNPAKLLEISVKTGIGVSAIGTGLEYSKNGLCFTASDEEVRKKTVLRFMEHIDFAANFGAVVFLGMCRGSSPDFASRQSYIDVLAGELVPVVEYAAARNVELVFEPIVFYLTNLLNTTQEVLEFLESPGLGSVRLLLDTHHMFIEDSDMFDSFRKCKGRISHIHISDSNRRYPGSGNIDYRTVGETLREIGYDRTASLEVLPYPDGITAASEGLAYMKRMI